MVKKYDADGNLIVNTDLEAEESEEEEELELEESEEDESPEPDEEENDDHKENAESEEEAEEDLVVTIGDDLPEEEEIKAAPKWVKEVRKKNSDLSKENRELKERLSSLENKKEEEVLPIGKEPDIEDFDYDTAAFKVAYQQWTDRKRKVEEAELKKQQAQQVAQEEWKEHLTRYEQKKANLKVKDFKAVEENITAVFDQTQQGIAVQYAENPALMFYALHKNPKRLNELAAIKDPIRFALAMKDTEKEIKMSDRKQKPPVPEKKPKKGSGSLSGAVDSTLERLRKEAEITGNYTKVVQYKRSKRKET